MSTLWLMIACNAWSMVGNQHVSPVVNLDIRLGRREDILQSRISFVWLAECRWNIMNLQ